MLWFPNIYVKTPGLWSPISRVCLLQDNILHGRYLAELTKEVLTDLEVSKYQHAEYRISIYGRKQVEWDILAAWYCQNKLYSDNVLWLIQVCLCCSSMGSVLQWMSLYYIRCKP